MADEVDSTNGNSPAPAPKSGGKGLVGTAILGVVCAVCAFGVVFVMAPSEASEPAVCSVAEDAESEALASTGLGYVELEDMLVTIGDGANSRFVKLTAVIMAPKDETGHVEDARPMLADAFLSYLRAIEVSDFEEKNFYPDMREQLSRRAELVLGPDRAHGVLITEFLLR